MRESKRRNKDGSTVSYLQLAHNERHPVTGSPVARVIHNFGRADAVDRQALRRLVSSISRFLEPTELESGVSCGEVEVVDARRFGGAFVLDRLFERLGIGEALRTAAAGRRLDAEATERIIFAWSPSVPWSRPRSWPPPAGWPNGWRSSAARVSRRTPLTAPWTS